MCNHIYLKHSCGHKSSSVEQCNPALTCTAAIFCDHYKIHRAGSIKKCGGFYCKEERETANWVENGLDLLYNCDYEIHHLKQQLEDCQRKLKAHSQYEKGWGPAQDEKTITKIKKIRQHAVHLVETLRDRKERQKYITEGLDTTKAKIDQTAQTLTKFMQAYRASMQHELQQRQSPVQGPPPAPAPTFVPMPVFNMPVFNMPVMQPSPSAQLSRNISTQQPQAQAQAQAQVWLPNDFRTVQTPPNYVHNKKTGPMVTQTWYSPQLTSPAFMPLTPVLGAEDLPKSKTSPPKKKRGRPSKSKAAEAAVIQVEPSNANKTPAKQNRKKPAENTNRQSSRTRRSGRLSGKQGVSYAESSTSASPEPSEAESAPRKPKVAMKSTKELATKTSTGPRRSTRKRNSKNQDEDEEFGVAEEEVDSDADTVMAEDDEWQDQDSQGADDISPVKTTRTSKKQVESTTPKMQRNLKRGAANSPATPVSRKKAKLDHLMLTDDIAMSLQPSASKGNWQFNSPTKWSVGGMASPWPAMQMSYMTPMQMSYMTPSVNLRGGHVPSFSTPPGTTKSPSKKLAHTPTNFFPGGVSFGDEPLLSVEDLVDDNVYDFDVALMSKAAGF